MNQALQEKLADPNELAATLFERVALSLARQPMNLSEYLKAAWPIVEPSRPLIWTWALDLILEHLAAVDSGQITRLLINVPPRSLKSTTVAVAWPTWSWTDKPWKRWLFCSYSSTLSVVHSISRRRILESDWYLGRWGDVCRLAIDQNQKGEYQNTQRGQMVSTSVGGSVTGKGGDVIVIDDLINPVEAESKVQREASLEFYRHTILTRLDDKKKGVIVAIEQRTHHLDLSGTLLKEGEWVHVCVPAEAPARTTVKFPLSGRELIREEGSVICEERENKATLLRQKLVMGNRAYAAQYQQDPVAADSGYFHVGWWRRYRMLPVDQYVREWSWDMAMEEGEENDYSVGVLLAHGVVGTYVERIVRGRWQYPDLKRVVLDEWAARPANAMLIEDTVSGKSLAQDLSRGTAIPVLPVKPAGDKVFRASLCSPYVESGRVHLPDDAVWVADFVDELSIFPQGAHDDQVDAFDQGMNHHYLGPGRMAVAFTQGNLVDGNPQPQPDWM